MPRTIAAAAAAHIGRTPHLSSAPLVLRPVLLTAEPRPPQSSLGRRSVPRLHLRTCWSSSMPRSQCERVPAKQLVGGVLGDPRGHAGSVSHGPQGLRRQLPAHPGRTFWLTWKALSGSYFVLTSA